ncbi:hypothetical protein ASPWEDRAFT_167672 [Aspergillus wentii DTO 134E9]|uniref:Ketosynthase family 3 (KS3) domain-containing protein n=1 Tax=Aspergillus wentii DTO 134E9 TaxID=1073089 RepID=A0A1L9S3D4_ASPWE|nr:uncharacterized protein ASPWEDRAFT_167672 [Aspergillus wentii DTO 134E9]OJJ41665.1 hypothetical protein ASPWEDRAFT_167672 [Aspergillus wentii DTO 134E9]
MSTPIAICGIGLRLPGGISTPAQLWDFLLEKKNAKSRVPESRYNVSSYYSKSGGNGVIKTEHGYFLDDNLAALDTSFFSFTKVELEAVDPQQRLLLEVVRECLESAGEVDYRGKDIGCFVGSYGDDWIQNLFHDPQMYSKYPLMVGGDFSIPNRILYEYDLRGPSMMIRTACSSATVGLHEACLAIQRGECSAAIVGGCNLVMSPTMTAIMSRKEFSRMTPPPRPLMPTLMDMAVERPSMPSISNHWQMPFVMETNKSCYQGHCNKLRWQNQWTYAAAGIDDISDTPFVECHGTGTAVGDPIEVAAIANTFGDRGIYIGAVKPNIGHSEGASGLTSLIKAVLALENQVVPPNINFNTPNPRIPFAEKKLTVPVESTPWPQDRDVRISVNSFGMGGVNAHVVLESAESFTPPCSPTEATAKAVSLLVFSANTSSSLHRLMDEHQQYLQIHPDSLANMAYTLGVRREHLPFRAASIVRQGSSIAVTTQMTKSSSSPPKVVFVFTGQGAQWPGVGVALYKSNPTFRRSILGLEEILCTLPQAPTWSIIDEMMNPVEKITPYAVVGHSSGELAAAYTAGKLTAREAFIFAFYRGVLSEHVKKTGGMAAVGMCKEETNQFLVPGVAIACDNSPSSVTISGDLEELVNVIQAIKKPRPDVLVRQLKVDLAYHSPHMKDLGDTYRSHMECFATNSSTARSPPVHFYSSVTGTCLDDSATLGPQYWQSNLESPVLFRTAIQGLISDNNGQFLFLEIGLHSALSGPTWSKGFGKPVNENVIQDDQVEIEVDTVGVNFKDVLVTLGIVNVADNRLGLEATGVVRKAQKCAIFPPETVSLQSVQDVLQQR